MDLGEIVCKICYEHQAKVTDYDDLVKGHVVQVAQQKKKHQKKIAKKNASPPLEADTQKEVSPMQASSSAPQEPVVHEPSSPRPTEAVPVVNPAHDENPTKNQDLFKVYAQWRRVTRDVGQTVRGHSPNSQKSLKVCQESEHIYHGMVLIG